MWGGRGNDWVGPMEQAGTGMREFTRVTRSSVHQSLSHAACAINSLARIHEPHRQLEQ